KSGEAGLSYELNWQAPVKAYAVQVNFAEEKIDQSANDEDYHAYKLFYKESENSPWKILVDKSQNKTSVAHDYVELARPVNLVALKIENVHAAKRGNFAIRDLRVFGKMKAAKPAAPINTAAVRDKNDPRNMKFTWKTQNPDAVKGYIINYGVAPDALHLSVQYQNPQAQELTLSCFNAEAKDYYFRIDADNEAGVSQGKVHTAVMGAE
ncbi:MAG: fibronectin type III domain-containing protein, partial [Opitutales bacterium]|nr:fibronectin type III domain-containing protein [Opitutales bacterium]